MAKTESDTASSLLSRGRQLTKQLEAEISADATLQALEIEAWLADVRSFAETSEAQSSLEQLKVIIDKVKIASTSARKRTKEQLLKSKRASKGKLAYQQQNK
ncbi:MULTISPECIES: hypothetical protein [Corallincola]|uniref:Uncharacterized protein n=3 Tax=Corallincola TaxID=1775176 RepID=A0A368N2Z0_9GAMM|nr:MULTISPECIES: hypothetical protein [Corallincola]RCU44576.1 hypothetical protein DU002_17610 [Corallincola holothuriorum]TAA40321.1 hypothetical protein EXY25_17860 [Corallincola spongiicola]TCI05372.1 hypothetical protein EZV61_05300 [Corallincola luteus]